MTVEWRDPGLLLERDQELAGLTAALEAAATGEGSLVVIADAAGTGKSALLAAVVERARERRLAIRRGRGSELEQELSFGVVRQWTDPVHWSTGCEGRWSGLGFTVVVGLPRCLAE